MSDTQKHFISFAITIHLFTSSLLISASSRLSSVVPKLFLSTLNTQHGFILKYSLLKLLVRAWTAASTAATKAYRNVVEIRSYYFHFLHKLFHSFLVLPSAESYLSIIFQKIYLHRSTLLLKHSKQQRSKLQSPLPAPHSNSSSNYLLRHWWNLNRNSQEDTPAIPSTAFRPGAPSPHGRST